MSTGAALALLMLLAFAFNGYYLRGGFQGDDFFFLNMMRQDPRPYSRWLGFWAVDDVPAVTNTWWFEGRGVGVFWRPVPSLIFEGIVRIFGERPFPLHLLSIIVHGLVACTLYILVHRLTGRALVALLAGAIFLSCEDHSLTVGWIATITDPIAVLFVNLALIAYTGWLARRRPWALAAALAALVPALLSKESAVVAPLAMALMALLLPHGHAEALPDRSGRRARLAAFARDGWSWVPALAMLGLYLAAYKLLGFGSITSGMYIDPFTRPGRYLVHLFGHLPVMWLATLSPVPPSLAMFVPVAIPFLAIAGAAAMIGLLAGLWSQRGSGVVAWALAVYLLALLPQMSTDASERALYFPMTAASLLLALLLVQIGPIARRCGATVRPPRPTRIAGWATFACVLIPGALLSATMPFLWLAGLERPCRDAASAAPHVAEKRPDHVLMLNTPGAIYTFYLPPIVEYCAGRPLDVRVLSSVNGIVTVERLDERAFVVRTDRAGWLDNIFASLLRAPGPLTPGRRYEKGTLTATLQELTADCRDVLAVRFELDRPLDDPGVLFLQWDGAEFRPFDLAALPAGEPILLADTSDVWASMW